MTYDPRKGSSTYLGMDGDTVGRESLGTGAPSTPTMILQEAETTRQHEGDTVRRDASQVPATVRRPSQAPQRGVAPMTPGMPQDPRPQQTMSGQTSRQKLTRPTSSNQAPRAVPSPQQQRFEPEPSPVPRAVASRLHKPMRMLKALALFALALVLRAGAILFAGLVVASAFTTGSARASLIGMLNLTPLLVPGSLLGQFVVETPFGGVFRGDLAIASIIMFCADWVCMWFSASLRYGRERGA